MSIATTAPQRSQGMILLSITSLASRERGGGSTGPASSGVAPKAASICRVNSSPKGLKIAVRCVVIGSDGSPTTSQEIWQRPSSNSCSKMRPNSHTMSKFRATRIANFLENGGTLEVAQRITRHAESSKSTLRFSSAYPLQELFCSVLARFASAPSLAHVWLKNFRFPLQLPNIL